MKNTSLPQSRQQSPAHPRARLRVPLLWAAFGLACVVFQTWVFAYWAAAGDAHAYPAGGYQTTFDRRAVTRAEEVIAAVGCVLMILACWRRSRAAGQVTWSAALLTGYFLAFWSDPYSGASHRAVGYNRYDLNVLTWGPYLPGWHGPRPQIESFLVDAAYPWVMLWIWAGVAIAALLRARQPEWSSRRLVTVTLCGTFLFDLVLEQAYMRLGGYAYPRALPGLTLFEGHYYQLPLTSPLCMVFLAVAPVVTMTVCAKPGEEIWLLAGTERLPRRRQPWIRLLAGIGFANACMITLQLVMLLASLVSHPVPMPSWFDQPHG